jgi:hypothetical protein
VRTAVVIVTWNSARFIRDCLNSVPASLRRDTLVVDNASTDDTVRIVREEFAEVRLAANPTNTEYARGNNQALKLAGVESKAGPHSVLLLNPDTRLPGDGIEKLAAYLEAHPDVGIVAPKLVNPDGTAQPSVRRFPTYRNMFQTMLGRAQDYRLRDFDSGRTQEVEQPMASCLLVRGEVFRRVGLFDERFPMFLNDVDFSRRVRAAGWKTVYYPEVAVWHYRGGSTELRRKRMILDAHRGLFRYFQKYDRSGWFWLKAVPLAILLEVTACIRMLFERLKAGRGRKD